MGFVPDMEVEIRAAKNRRDRLIAGVGGPFTVVVENYSEYTESVLGPYDDFEEAEKIAKKAQEKGRRKKYSVIVTIRNRHNQNVYTAV